MSFYLFICETFLFSYVYMCVATQLVFVFYRLGDFYIVRDHIVVFSFFFSSEKSRYLSRAFFWSLSLFFFFFYDICLFSLYAFLYIEKSYITKVNDKKWNGSRLFVVLLLSFIWMAYTTRKTTILWITWKNHSKSLKITFKNSLHYLKDNVFSIFFPRNYDNFYQKCFDQFFSQ